MNHLPLGCDASSTCAHDPMAHYSVLSQVMGLCADHLHLAPKGRVIHQIRKEEKVMGVISLPVCWECMEDGGSWEYDCDQCNVDGMYTREGKVRRDYI